MDIDQLLADNSCVTMPVLLCDSNPVINANALTFSNLKQRADRVSA